MKSNTIPRGMLAICLAAAMSGHSVRISHLEPFADSVRIDNEEPSLRPLKAEEGDMEMLDYTLAFSAYEALTLGSEYVGRNVWQAFRFTPEMATLYAGAKVSSVNIWSGTNKSSKTNKIKDVTVFLMDDFGDDPFMEQKGTLGSRAMTQNRIDLDEPYEIEAGKGFVVAYMCTPPTVNDYYVTVDAIAHNTDDGCFIGLSEADGSVTWKEFGREIGNLNIGVTLTAENLPHDGVSVFAAQVPETIAPGQPFDLDMVIVGGAVNEVESVEVSWTIGGGSVSRKTIELEQPLKYGAYTYVSFPGLVSETEGDDVRVDFSVTKVNGADNCFPDPITRLSMICFEPSKGFPHRYLVEEGTGTWCIWCPAGIVMMEYLKEKYPEDFIRVALHAQDQMSEESVESMVYGLFQSFPSAVIDRNVKVSPTDANTLEAIDAYFDATHGTPSFAEVSEIRVVSEPEQMISLESDCRFAIPVEPAGRYGISYYIVEDNVGPYIQQNAYAGGGNGQMGDWADMKSTVLMTFDDVAMYNEGGFEGTGVWNPVSSDASAFTSAVKLPLDMVDGESFRIVAVLTDNLTGTVLNSRQITVDMNGNSVKSQHGPEFSLVVCDTGVKVEGEFGFGKVFDLNGRQWADLAPGETVGLPRGVYVLWVDGKVCKFMI